MTRLIGGNIRTLIRGKGDLMRTRVRIIWLPDLPG